MIEQQRLVLIIESSDPKHLDFMAKISHYENQIDEVRLVIPKDQFSLKGVAVHWKYRDSRIRIHYDTVAKHLARKCQDHDTIYAVIGSKACWISPGSVRLMAEAHCKWKEHFITFMALAASDKTGYLMQVMGLLPDALIHPWHADYLSTYKLDRAEIQQEAHEQILHCAKTKQMNLLDFGRWIVDAKHPLHSDVFCFRGDEWSAAVFFVKKSQINTSEELILQASHIGLADLGKCNAICGSAWCAADNSRTQEVKHRYMQEVEYV